MRVVGRGQLGWVRYVVGGLLALFALCACKADDGGTRGPGRPGTVLVPGGGASGGASDPGGSSGGGDPAGTGQAGSDPVASGGAGTAVDPPVGGQGGGGPAAPTEFDAGSAPGLNAVTPGQLCERLSTLQCAGEAHCCPSPTRDFATCKDKYFTGCKNELLFDEIAAQPMAGFDAASAERVFTEIESRAKACDITIAAFGESMDGLRSMFLGTVGVGGNCRPSSLLQKAASGAALAACTERATEACLPSAINWRCTPHADEGGACFSDANCNAGLYCDNPGLALSGGECIVRKAVGAPCGQPNECDTLYCKGGSCVAADVTAAYCLD